MNDISRRLAIRTLALTPAICAAREAMQVGNRTDGQPASPGSKTSEPKAFEAHQYSMLRSLCESIIPADEASGGALDASVPELIDLLASENEDYRTRLNRRSPMARCRMF